MDFSDRIEAYYFSLETMATIGYGTQDYFFGHCWEPLVIINVQVVCSLVIESLYFGIIFHRLTRGRKRQSTVLFSDIDNDGDLDIWEAGGSPFSGTAYAILHMNDGHGHFSSLSDPSNVITTARSAACAEWGDFVSPRAIAA